MMGADRGMQDLDDKYDVYVLGEVEGRGPVSSVSLGWQGLNTTLHEARRTLGLLRNGGLAALVSPSVYAAPRITKESALEIITSEFHVLRARGLDLSDLGEMEEGVAWWIASADDLQAQRDGFIPGMCRIAVDKLDGHVLTPDEMADFYALSALDQFASNPGA